MRCPSCGTENAPDSRFCGGCGGKLTPVSKPPLAATAKIPDDAPFPAPTGQRPQIQQGYQQGPPSIPPGDPYAATGPASIPPTARGPSSIPPHASYQRAPTPPPTGASLSTRPTPLAPELRPASQGRGDEPAFASMPPTQQRKPVARPTPVPAGSMAGDSFVVPPQRPLGLIAIVLVIDFALAGAGAVMLSKGLAKKTPEEVGTPKAPQQKMEQRTEVTPPPAPTPAPAPSASPSEAVAAAAPPVADAKPDTKLPASAGALVEAKPDKNPTRGKEKASDTKKKGTSSSAATTSPTTTPSSGPVTHPGGGTAPEDPYKDSPTAQPAPAPSGFDLKAESNKLASGSGDLFARCLSAAGTVHGTIKIAYRVQANGAVEHPFAVENSTGNEQLGICLADVIATWRFSSHTGDAQNAVRPFNYP